MNFLSKFFNFQYQSSKQIKEQLTARDLAYRPTVPQGWQRAVNLPAGKNPTNFLIVLNSQFELQHFAFNNLL